MSQKKDGINIHDINFKTKRDNVGVPFPTHTRITEYSSNRVAIRCEHACNIYNINFDSFEIDVLSCTENDSADDERVEFINISNVRSVNVSNPILAFRTKNISVDNVILTPAMDLGSGDHAIYVSYYCDNLTVKDSILIAPDSNLGVLINLQEASYDTAEAVLKQFHMRNCLTKSKALVSASYDTDITISNCDMTFPFGILSSVAIVSVQKKFFKSCLYWNRNYY